MAVIQAAPITTSELLAMPEDGVDRWLIQGQLREQPMTKRNRWHSRIMVRVGQLLNNWLDEQPEPRGEVLGGEAGCIISRDPDTTVGIDVCYVSAEVALVDSAETTLIDGAPTLAVEILSPSDKEEDINEKIDAYQDARVPLVWIIDPHDETILVYRLDREPELVNKSQELTAEPHLPGFRVGAAQVFE